MLKLINIKKDYTVADSVVKALKGINLCFRKNEFVSVLGPSGCGKTTLLNIIGGLDKSTSGDLIIQGKSTREYSDRDWDVYRNHRIGFIFQSYNLIPHQTVLGNVELALTIAGIDKITRVEKAKAALDKVGLSDQYYKKPNQLSGGQCQRVAIARALVNDPEILLADEPTGALDTTTSKQIMDLIKDIAKERLVIMVTHNPELANEYSTRIIRLLDGLLLSDSNPFSEEAEKDEVKKMQTAQLQAEAKIPKKKRQEKARMSFATAFKLSLQNLFSKKKRTLMTSIAGSIGIIGVSLVLAISFGVQGYIDRMQNDMLSGNPITIEQTGFDLNAMLSGMSNQDRQKFVKENGYVNVEALMKDLAKRANTMENMFVTNNIDRDYINYLNNMPKEYLSALFYDYGLDLRNNIYTNFVDSNPNYPNGRDVSLSGILAVYSSILGEIEQFKNYTSMIGSLTESFRQAPDAEKYLLSQYNILATANGHSGVAKAKNEIMIVLGKDRTLSDLLLAQLGYFTQDEFINIVNKAAELDYDEDSLITKIDYDKLLGKTFTWYPNNSVFTASSPFTYNPYYVGDEGLELKVVAILEPKEEYSYGMLDSGLYYTSELAEYALEQNYNSDIVKTLRDSDSTAYTSVATFIPKGTDMGGGIVTPEDSFLYTGIKFNYSYTWNGNTTEATGLVGTSSDMSAMLSLFGGGTSSSGTTQILATTSLSLQQLGGNVDVNIVRDEDDKLISWEVNLTDGKIFALPNKIAIYPLDLQQKTKVLAYLDDWNSSNDIVIGDKTLTADEREKITYTDALSIMMTMISTLLNTITIALVSFTSLSLVVSCVMIAIITYVSVVERIKEIGVIRSLGGRKSDVSNLFIAETFIIGLVAGLIGILVTYLLSTLINLLVGLAGISTIAALPPQVAFIMICVSIALTLISGLMPSQSAANKDPVVALRSE